MSPVLWMTFPEDIGLSKAWVNGELALDRSIESKHEHGVNSLRVVYPGDEPLQIELLTATAAPFTLSLVTWHELPGVLVAPFMGNWPDEARSVLFGPRAEKIQEIQLRGVAQPEDAPVRDRNSL
jgi:hypothetical protein